MRGFGLPGCGRGVTVPTSMKPKPSAPSASMCAPFLSRPGGEADRVAESRGPSPDAAGRPCGARPAERSPMRPRARGCRSVSSCATSGSSWKSSGAREGIKHAAIYDASGGSAPG